MTSWGSIWHPLRHVQMGPKWGLKRGQNGVKKGSYGVKMGFFGIFVISTLSSQCLHEWFLRFWSEVPKVAFLALWSKWGQGGSLLTIWCIFGRRKRPFLTPVDFFFSKMSFFAFSWFFVFFGMFDSEGSFVIMNSSWIFHPYDHKWPEWRKPQKGPFLAFFKSAQKRYFGPVWQFCDPASILSSS